jgi:hypothetical protein
MKPVGDMSEDELRSAYRDRCIAWLAADHSNEPMSMLIHASIQGMILEEWDRRLRDARLTRLRPVMTVIAGGKHA